MTVTLTKAHNGLYFLAGNPFMCHLDMAVFLKENSGVLKPKYWTMGADGVRSALLANNGITSAGGTDMSTVAPMEGFFVEANTPGTDVTVKYTTGMMTTAVAIQAPQPAPGDWMRISAGDNAALIRIAGECGREYDRNEDVALICGSTQEEATLVYTVAENVAATVNSTPDASGTEIGVMTGDGESNVLRFEGPACGYHTLYDASTGETMALHDGFEYEVTGNVSHRLYLSADTGQLPALTGLDMTVDGNEVTVTPPAAAGEMRVEVCDISGKSVYGCTGRGETRFMLPQGMYVMKATAADGCSGVWKIRIE